MTSTTQTHQPKQEVDGFFAAVEQGYGGGKSMPLASYAKLVAAYHAIFGTAALGVAILGRLPKTVSIKDLLLLGVATHKISRLITKDWVTAPIRAPFTK